MGKRLSASQHGETVGLDDERLAVVLGHDVKDDTRHEQQQPGDDKHDRPISVGNRATMPVFQKSTVTVPHSTTPMMPRTQPMPPKNGSGLYSRIMRKMVPITLIPSPTVSSLLTDPSGAIPILNRHLVKAEVVVQRVDGHLGFRPRSRATTQDRS